MVFIKFGNWICQPEVNVDVKIDPTVKEGDRFIKTQVWNDNFIFYDKETNVQYYYAAGAMTVLVDQNGKPLLYEGGK